MMEFDEDEDPAEETEEPAMGAAGRGAARLSSRLQRRPVPVDRFRRELTHLHRFPEGGETAPPTLVNAGRSREGSSLLSRGETPQRPELVFFQPPPEPSGEGGEPPSETATDTGGGARAGGNGSKKPPEPQRVDARAVADRVYELMRQEVFHARLRGGGSSGQK